MLLEAEITKQLKEFELRASFTLEQEVLGIMGSSGSGKSMLLKCLAGIETPDSGRIVLNNRVLFDSQQKINLVPQQRSIGYLFQSYALFPNMSVQENILCGLRAKKLPEAACLAKAGELIERFRLQGLANRYPRQISGGQKQRTAVARLLAAEPQIILLDEPFSALDTKLKEELKTEMRDFLQEYDGAAILVSHDKSEIELLSSRHYRIVSGLLKEEVEI